MTAEPEPEMPVELAVRVLSALAAFDRHASLRDLRGVIAELRVGLELLEARCRP